MAVADSKLLASFDRGLADRLEDYWTGEIKDAKTIMLLQYAALNLFA